MNHAPSVKGFVTVLRPSAQTLHKNHNYGIQGFCKSGPEKDHPVTLQGSNYTRVYHISWSWIAVTPTRRLLHSQLLPLQIVGQLFSYCFLGFCGTPSNYRTYLFFNPLVNRKTEKGQMRSPQNDPSISLTCSHVTVTFWQHTAHATDNAHIYDRKLILKGANARKPFLWLKTDFSNIWAKWVCSNLSWVMISLQKQLPRLVCVAVLQVKNNQQNSASWKPFYKVSQISNPYRWQRCGWWALSPKKGHYFSIWNWGFSAMP